jgi:NADH-quinone oxidoreductase subunit B
MGVMAGANTAGGDHEVAVQALNRELSDKGFILTSTEDHHQLGADRQPACG